MTHSQGCPTEIHEPGRYEVRPEALERCLVAIHEFVAYVRDNELDALRYDVWPESAHPRASCTSSPGAMRKPTGSTASPPP
jgi:hypothetical protein